MYEAEPGRPDPDRLLHQLTRPQQGKLKVFLGYAAGVGKTYAMLDEAQSLLKNGVDVVVGYVEPHTRPQTLQLLEGLPILPPLEVPYKSITLQEFDLEAALKRKPAVLLVDELAHSNARGVRNKKRYQDIEEFLAAGISVYTTVNVQHLESRCDMVEEFTGAPVRETVPDYIFDNAELVRLIDLVPEELLTRLREGKIYSPDRAATALDHFFTQGNLQLLRELSMRKAAERLGSENQSNVGHGGSASQRFLVCIGPSPSSQKCIRWTARMAEVLHAPWTVLYVETPKSLQFTPAQQQSLRLNLDLAERLGGELVTLSGLDIAETVGEYARTAGITNVVIGKSRMKRTLRTLFRTELDDKLFAKLPHTEIYIIPDEETANTPRKFRLTTPHLTQTDALRTLGLLVAATLVSLFLNEIGIGEQNVIMVYILSVLVISRVTTGYAYGVAASLVSVLIFNFLFVPPLYSFSTFKPGYPVTFGIMLLVALFTSGLMIRIKTQARLAVTRERRTEILYEINKKLLVTREISGLVALTSGYVTKLFGRSVVFYSDDPQQGCLGVVAAVAGDQNAQVLSDPDERAVAHWVFANGKRAGCGTDTLMGAAGYYMPIVAQGAVLGVLGLSCHDGIPLTHDNRAFLRMIGSQVAMALERQRLSDEQQRILVESERETMRSNLLRAISHDLRTPLTAISGASSAVLENPALDAATRDKLIGDIRTDALWLIRMVENLLSVTRLTESTANLAKMPEAAEEVVAGAAARVRGKYPRGDLTVRVPEELLMVPMDATLIEQVLINLLENALKYGGENPTVELTVKKQGNTAVFEVGDDGEGIPPERLAGLFEGYLPGRGQTVDGTRGMGIGLSICRSIVKAHGGRIEAQNKQTGGALFRFVLPLDGGNLHEQ